MAQRRGRDGDRLDPELERRLDELTLDTAAATPSAEPQR
jgi:hypothetical protein